MRLDLYQNETALIAQEQNSLLDEASERLNSGGILSRLEQNGVYCFITDFLIKPI